MPIGPIGTRKCYSSRSVSFQPDDHKRRVRADMPPLDRTAAFSPRRSL